MGARYSLRWGFSRKKTYDLPERGGKKNALRFEKKKGNIWKEDSKKAFQWGRLEKRIQR